MAMKEFETLTFCDDFMFRKVMTQYEEICRQIVELCIGRKVHEICYKEGQKTMKVLPEGKGIRLDVYLEDEDRTLYDLEMQATEKPLPGKRMRYYSGMMDINALEQGQNYEQLPDSYVVFICRFDPFRERRPVYEFRMRDRENHDLLLGDGTTLILISTCGDESGCSAEMKSFLAAVRGERPGYGLGERISNAVAEIRSHEKWRAEYMMLSLKMEEMMHEGYRDGFAKGRAEGRAAVVDRMIAAGKSDDEILEMTGVSADELQSRRQEHV